MVRASTFVGCLFSCIFLVHGFAPAGELADAPRRAIRRSDVVFMYDNPRMYQPYGCTVLGWAGGANAERIRRAHSQGVRLFSTSVGFRTEFRRVIDFSRDFLEAACRNFEGKPFVVPWLWDHKYKDQPAWWWCTNSPLYRKYLDRAGRAAHRRLHRHGRDGDLAIGLLLPILPGRFSRVSRKERLQRRVARAGH